MITKQDLLEAIAECQGTRAPNANTAIKLAAFYTILDHLEDDAGHGANSLSVCHDYSFSGTGESVIRYDGATEFAKVIDGRRQEEVLPVMDELMTTLKVMHPRLYNGVMQKLVQGSE